MIGNLFVQKKSIIHDLDFWTKFVCFLLFLPLSAFLASPKVLLVLLGFLVLLLFLSYIGLIKFWQSAKLYLIPLSIGIIVLSLLFSSGNFETRFLEGLILVIRFTVLISFGILFAMTTNPIEIPGGFLRAHLPHKFGITLMVGYRMMPLISNKITTVINAQKARGANTGFSLKNPGQFFYFASSLIVPIIHSTLETSVRLSDTLISRGYDPEGKITVPETKFSLFDYLIFSFALAITLLGFLIH